MDVSGIRQQLHQYIDMASGEQIVDLFAFAFGIDLTPRNYSSGELNEFYRQREKFLTGESKGYSVEEVHDRIRRTLIK
jgi:hypothetical protein